MSTPEPTIPQQKLHQLADHLRAASDLLRELASEKILPLSDDQAWFSKEEWQALEKEADRAMKNGEYKDFDTIGDALDFLHQQV